MSSFANAPYFYEPSLDSGSTLHTLSADSLKHAHVLRLNPGDALVMTNGLGGLFNAVISSVDRKACLVGIKSSSQEPRHERKFVMGVSLLKNTARFEWFLEKAVELGVHTVVPLLCKRTDKKGGRVDRLRQIMVSAMLQSRQTWLPGLAGPTDFGATLSAYPARQRLIAHCAPAPRSPLGSCKLAHDVLLLIGPEGDFTDEEVAHAVQQGCLGVSLGQTRLRTETAAVAACSVLSLSEV